MSDGERYIKVNGTFDALVLSLDRADRRGYMPDALVDEWEKFDWTEAAFGENLLDTIDAILYQCDRGNVSLPWLVDCLRGIKVRSTTPAVAETQIGMDGKPFLTPEQFVRLTPEQQRQWHSEHSEAK